MAKQIKDCPKCGVKQGFYRKFVMAYEQYYDQNGKPENYEGTSSRGGKRAFCTNCSRDITQLISTLDKEREEA